ncbi:MAG: WG repeat-containing protein [Acidobacteriota bacterium]
MSFRCASFIVIAGLVIMTSFGERVRILTKHTDPGSLSQIVSNGKWGFADSSGKVVIAPSFQDEREFSNGLAAVMISDRWGYIDQKGKFVIPAQFNEVRDFTDDLAPVRIDRKWGYIDLSGQMVIEPRYQSTGEFHQGLARIWIWANVACTQGQFTSENAPPWAFHFLEDDQTDLPSCFSRDGKMGFIDKSGKLVIPARFAEANDFAEGMAAVRVEEGVDSKFGYLDQTGAFAIMPQFNQAYAFSEGLAAVEIGGTAVDHQLLGATWGFIDKAGEFRIPATFAYAYTFIKGRALVVNKPGENGRFINHSGDFVK